MTTLSVQMLVLNFIISYQNVQVHGTNFYQINAVVMSKKGQSYKENFEQVQEAILEHKPSPYHCIVNFTSLEYDTTNGDTVYKSLEKARATFQDNTNTVAVGPSIDVFTSKEYVILNQFHFLIGTNEDVGHDFRALPIFPDSKSFSLAVAEVIHEFDWPKVAFLSQDDFSPVLALSNRKIFVWPIRLPTRISSPDDPELKLTMTKLREARMHHFVLHSLRKEVVLNVLQAAEEMHLLHYTMSWFVTYLDFEDIARELKTHVSIYGFQLLDADKIPLSLIGKANFRDFSRLLVGLMVDVVNLLHHYLNEDKSRIVCSEQPDNDVPMLAHHFNDLMEKTVLPYVGAMGQYVWSKSADGNSRRRTSYAIAVFKHNKDNSTDNFIHKVGNCTFNGEPKYYSLVDEPAQRSIGRIQNILQGNDFHVVTKQDPPFVSKRGKEFVGFSIDVLHELSTLMGFTYHITEFHSKWAGQEDREWEDLIHKLLIGNASMAIGALVVKAKREEIISFSYTLMSNPVSILLKSPPLQPAFFQFLWPFSTDLWLMILGFFFIVGISLYLMTKYDSTQRSAEQKFDLKESMWYSLNVLLQGGTEFSPQTTSMRTIVAFFWFCTLIITAAYTANLAAFLTLRQVDNRIKSVQNLASQAKVKYGILNNSDLMTFFEQSTVDPYERMWAFMKLNNSFVNSREEGVAKVLSSTEKNAFAFLDDGMFNDYYAKHYCNMESTEQGFGYKHYAIGFPKGAPFKDDINRAILKLKEDGVLDTLRNKWWSRGENCTGQVTNQAGSNPTGSLELENMVGVFIVLGVTVVLAVMVEIGKKIYLAVKERKEDRHNESEPEMRKVSLDEIFMKPHNSTFA